MSNFDNFLSNALSKASSVNTPPEAKPVSLVDRNPNYSYTKSLSKINLDNYEGYTGKVILPEQGKEEFLTEMRAQNQSTTGQWVNGVGKLVGKTATNIVGGLAMIPSGIGVALGQVADVATGEDNFKFSDVYDNAFQQTLDDANNWMDENLPNYRTRAEQEMSLGRQMLTSNFWADDFLGGMSFVLGAILTEGAASMTAAKLIGKAGKLGKMLQASAKAEDVAQAWQKYGRLVQQQKALGILRQTVTGAGYEAGVEARHFKNDAMKEAKEMHIKNFGNEPTEEEMAQYEDEINGVANGLFFTNLALVSIGNAVTLTKTFGRPLGKFIKNNPVSNAVDNMFNPLKMVDGKMVVGQSSKMARALRTTFKGLEKPFTEGIFEEGLQGAMSSASMDYIMKKLDPENIDNTASLTESFIHGLEETYGSQDGWKEILIGGILGSTGVYSPGTGWQGSGIKDAVDAWTGRDKDTFRKMADRYNNLETMPIFQNAFKANARQYGYQKEMDAALELGDLFNAKNAENSAVSAWMDSRYETGQLDIDSQNFVNEIKNMSHEQFRENFGYSENLSKEEVESRKKQTIEAFEQNVDNYKKSREQAERVVYNEEDTDLIEGITHTLMGIKNLDFREEYIAKELAEKTGVDGRTLKEIMRANAQIGRKQSEINTFITAHQKGTKKVKDTLNSAKKALNKIGIAFDNLDNIDSISTILEETLNQLNAEKKAGTLNSNLEKVRERLVEARDELTSLEKEEFKARAENRYETKYERGDFDKFQEDVRRLRKLEDQVNRYYETNPIDRLSMERQLNDLHRIAARREQLINEYNYFATKKGQEDFKTVVDSLKENLDKRIAIDAKEFEIKKLELLKSQSELLAAEDELAKDPTNYAIQRKVEHYNDKFNRAAENMGLDISEKGKPFEQMGQESIARQMANADFTNLQEYQSATYRALSNAMKTVGVAMGVKDEEETPDEADAKDEDTPEGTGEVKSGLEADWEDLTGEGKTIEKAESNVKDSSYILNTINSLFDVYNKYFSPEQKLEYDALMADIDRMYASEGKDWYKHFDYKLEIEEYNPQSKESPATGNPNVFVSNGINVNGKTVAVKVYGKIKDRWVEMGALTDPRRFVDAKTKAVIKPVNDDGSIRIEDIKRFNPSFVDRMDVTPKGKDFVEKWILMDNLFNEIKAGNTPNIKDYLKSEYHFLNFFEQSKLSQFSDEVHGISSPDLNNKGIILKIGDRYHQRVNGVWNELTGGELTAAKEIYNNAISGQGANEKSINDTVLLLNNAAGRLMYMNTKLPLGTRADMEIVNDRLNELFDNMQELRGETREETRDNIANALGIELTNTNPKAGINLFPDNFNIGLGGISWRKPQIFVNQAPSGKIFVDLSMQIKGLGRLTIRKSGGSFTVELSVLEFKKVSKDGKVHYLPGNPKNANERIDNFVQKINLKPDEKLSISEIVKVLTGERNGVGGKNAISEALSRFGIEPKYSEKNIGEEDPFASGNFDNVTTESSLRSEVVLRPFKDAIVDLDIPVATNKQTVKQNQPSNEWVDINEKPTTISDEWVDINDKGTQTNQGIQQEEGWEPIGNAQQVINQEESKSEQPIENQTKTASIEQPAVKISTTNNREEANRIINEEITGGYTKGGFNTLYENREGLKLDPRLLQIPELERLRKQWTDQNWTLEQRKKNNAPLINIDQEVIITKYSKDGNNYLIAATYTRNPNSKFTSDRSGYFYVSIKDNGNLPNNIEQILKKSLAIEHEKLMKELGSSEELAPLSKEIQDKINADYENSFISKNNSSVEQESGSIDDMLNSLTDDSGSVQDVNNDDNIPFSISDNLNELISSGEVTFVDETGKPCK